MKTLSKDEAKRIRKESGLTQKTLAQLFNVSLQTVKFWETGRNRISGTSVIAYENIVYLINQEREEKITDASSTTGVKKDTPTATMVNNVNSSRWEENGTYKLINYAEQSQLIISGQELDIIDIEYGIEDDDIDCDGDIVIEDLNRYKRMLTLIKSIREKPAHQI